MIRADTIRHSANARKVEHVLAFTRCYRACAAAIAAREWRAFFEAGAFGGKYGNVSAFNAYCGAAPAQMARAQVAAMLRSFLANRQNEFRDAVTRSSLASAVKHALHTINGRRAGGGDFIEAGCGALIPTLQRREEKLRIDRLERVGAGRG